MTHVVTRNLNKIIDINYYPVETARRSNMRHRPIGIGVQARRPAWHPSGHPADVLFWVMLSLQHKLSTALFVHVK